MAQIDTTVPTKQGLTYVLPPYGAPDGAPPREKERGTIRMEDQYEPLIVAFCCNWCSYAGADLAGVSRIQYPPNGRIIRVMCSGMVHPNLVINALTKGADGVLVCG
jgi:F420-non-reducing hydrogenase iron-sulfur subunit